jgi:hypothetical protein
MSTLKCLQENKQNSKNKPPVDPEKRSINKEDDLLDLFPLPRYFQVHFEYIHDNTNELQIQINQLKETLEKVEGKLDRFIALLDDQIEPGY